MVRVGLWALVASFTVIAAAACGSDGAAPSPCKSQCGDAGANDSGKAGHAGSAGDAGSDSGATPQGGSAGEAGEASATAGEAGEAGGVGDAGAGAGGGGGGGAPLVRHWLAFDEAFSSFVYDTDRYPSSKGLYPLGDGNVLGWSPDGRRVLYLDGDVIYSRDMSGAIPGEATLLTPVGGLPDVNGPQFAWSADSRFVAEIAESSLIVFDGTKAAPAIQTLTTSLKFYSWAPSGNRLLYGDDTGAWAVRFEAGKASTPQPVTANEDSAWSPTGLQLATSTSKGKVVLVTLSGSAVPEEKTISAPTQAQASAFGLQFDASGSKLAFLGVQTRAQQDATYVPITPSIGSPKLAYAPPQPGEYAAALAWSPDGRWLLSALLGGATPRAVAVDLSGAQPGTPQPLSLDFFIGDLAPVWLPDSLSFVVVTNVNKLWLHSIPLAPNPVKLLEGQQLFGFAVNPQTAVLAYATAEALHLRNLTSLQAPIVDIPRVIDPNKYDASRFEWSSDGAFLAVADETSGAYRQRLARVDGTSPSALVTLRADAEGSAAYAVPYWQP